jgi:hypothetical protein
VISPNSHGLLDESDYDNISQSESEAEEVDQDQHLVDKRTLNKIAEAERTELVKASDVQNCKRRSNRMKFATKQTGLDVNNFGIIAMQTSLTSTASTPSVLALETPPTSHRSLPVLRQSDVSIPTTRRNALRTPFAKYWIMAMDAEIASIKSHNTYVVVNKPAHPVNIVSSKWVFDTKCKDGIVVRFKARLVARGFSQQLGVDYDETYSPVLKYMTLRILLSIIAIKDYILELMDVQTAYLNAELKETVYMKQPEGYEEGGTSSVCLLRKALYGLKQAGREWNIHLDEFVRSLGFTRCINDTCLYIRQSRTNRILLLSVYVDDIPSAFAPEDTVEWGEIKAAFSNDLRFHS